MATAGFSGSDAPQSPEGRDVQRAASSCFDDDMPTMQMTSLHRRRSDSGAESSDDMWTPPPSPLPVSVSRTLTGSGARPGSSPCLVKRGPNDRINRGRGKKAPCCVTSTMSLHKTMRRAHRPLGGSLMSPQPSPPRHDTNAADLLETHPRGSQRVLCENEELRRELAAAKASLQKALKTLELRELECMELHRLADRMQSELKSVKCVDNYSSVSSVPRSAGQTHLHSTTSVGALETTTTTTTAKKSGVEKKIEAVRAPSPPPSSETAVGDGEALRRACRERDALAVELAQVKVVVAEQEAVLDRLGLRSPFPAAMVAAAHRVMEAFKPLN